MMIQLKEKHKCLLVFCSAVISLFTVAPFSLWFLYPVSLAGFILSITGDSPRVAFRRGVVYGAFFYGLTLSWVFSVFPGGFPIVLFLLFSLFHGVFAALYVRLQSRRIHELGLIVAGAFLWTGLEYIRSEVFFLKFPWSTAGMALGPSALSAFIGVYGLSFLCAGGVLAICRCMRWQRIVGFTVLLALVALKGALLLSDPEVPTQPIPVTLIQNESGLFTELVEQTEEALPESGIIAWPEYSLSYDPRISPSDMQTFVRFTESGQAFVMGCIEMIPDSEDWYNTALTVENGSAIGTHVKNHTVHFFNDGIPGQTAEPIAMTVGKIGTPICFDGDYQDVYLQMTRNGAEAFVAPTMDAIKWTARQHIDHSHFTRHRAAENRRWVAVPSSSGVTQIIDPYGRQVKSLPLMEPGVLRGEIELRQDLTFFSQYGWVFGWVCVVISGIVALLALCVLPARE